MRYGGSKLKKPEKMGFFGYFLPLLEVAYMQTTLGRNPTYSFRDIYPQTSIFSIFVKYVWSQ